MKGPFFDSARGDYYISENTLLVHRILLHRAISGGKVGAGAITIPQFSWKACFNRFGGALRDMDMLDAFRLDFQPSYFNNFYPTISKEDLLGDITDRYVEFFESFWDNDIDTSIFFGESFFGGALHHIDERLFEFIDLEWTGNDEYKDRIMGYWLEYLRKFEDDELITIPDPEIPTKNFYKFKKQEEVMGSYLNDKYENFGAPFFLDLNDIKDQGVLPYHYIFLANESGRLGITCMSNPIEIKGVEQQYLGVNIMMDSPIGDVTELDTADRVITEMKTEAPNGVVLSSIGELSVDGHYVGSVSPSTQPFYLLDILIQNANKKVSYEDIVAQIKKDHDLVVGGRSAADIAQGIKRCIKSKEIKSYIQTSKGGYAFCIPSK